MFIKVENLPKSILFWRSLTEWVSGVGVIVLMLTILVKPGTVAAKLYISEARMDKLEPTVKSTVREIWWIYVLYTGVGVCLLYLAGMPLFDAVNHAMTAIATGGFSVKNGSIGEYNSPVIEVAVIFIMLLGMTSFVVHKKILQGRFSEFLNNTEVKLMFCLILFFSVFVLLDLMAKTSIPFPLAIRQAFFFSMCFSSFRYGFFNSQNFYVG